MHPGQQFVFDIGRNLLNVIISRLLRQVPHLKTEFAGVRHNIESATPLDGSNMQGTVRHPIALIDQTVFAYLSIDTTNMGDEFCRHLYRIDTFYGVSRVCSTALNTDTPAVLTLMRVDHLHHCGFADDSHGRFNGVIAQYIEKPSHTDAPNLLIVGERQMHRCQQRLFHHLRNSGECAGDKPLHIRGSPAIECAGIGSHNEGIRRPVLSVNRHHVCMA